jgi:hypothetical protein
MRKLRYHTNVDLLKSKMALRGDSVFGSKIASICGIARQTASLKLANERYFTQPEIKALVDHYHLSSGEVYAIFFAPEVEKEVL